MPGLSEVLYGTACFHGVHGVRIYRFPPRVHIPLQVRVSTLNQQPTNLPSPVNGYWDWTLMDPKCIDDWVGTMAAAIINTFSEFIVATLPLMAVFFLQVDKRQRWNVVALLSLGFFVAIIGCIRCVYVWKALTSYDLTWWSGPGWVCANVEIDVALVIL